jgi:CelD/BcsL family acetyltransferase involved in cellulose biosynthesis
MAVPAPVPDSRMAVTIHADPDAVAASWRLLEGSGLGSGYQTLAWAKAWFSTSTSAAGRTPLVCLFGPPEDPAGILPLEVAEIGLARVGRGPGSRHANFRGLLMAPDARDLPWDWMLAEAATAARIDAILLANQIVDTPLGRHPLADLPQSRPSLAYAARLDLTSNPDETLAKVLGKGSRKTMGKKLRHLSAFGPVSMRRAETPQDIQSLMDFFFREKSARLAELGVPDTFADPAVQDFLMAATRADVGAMKLHGAWCGDRPVAMFGGVELGGRLSGCINAHELEPEIARCSPGDMLFAEVIRDAASRGLSVFDLGVGHGPLKERFCERDEPMFDTGIAVSPLGTCALLMLSATDWMKETLKRDERIAGPARRIAGWLGALR